MISVRRYTYFSDYRIISSWYEAYDEQAPMDSYFPKESTFICEIDGVPALSASLYYTNARPYVIVENFISNPKTKGPMRKEATRCLLKVLKEEADLHGGKHLIAFPRNEKLSSYYEELGFTTDLGVHKVLATEVK